jgi:hypothetical protein
MWGGVMAILAQNAPDVEQRADSRVNVRLEGKLFFSAEETSFDCTIVDLSAGGAGIYCAEAPPLNTPVVLYASGFGRFEGVVTRYVKGEMGLRFDCNEAKRNRLEEDLQGYVQEGMLGVTRLRRFQRGTARAPIGQFTRANGEVVACEVIDISLQGVSLHSRVHPPIGEVIELGLTKGWVVRHFHHGIGVQFLQRPAPVG